MPSKKNKSNGKKLTEEERAKLLSKYNFTSIPKKEMPVAPEKVSDVNISAAFLTVKTHGNANAAADGTILRHALSVDS